MICQPCSVVSAVMGRPSTAEQGERRRRDERQAEETADRPAVVDESWPMWYACSKTAREAVRVTAVAVSLSGCPWPLLEEMWFDLAYRRKQIPSGLRDYLPDELLRRRALERRITSVFSRWGYQELVTPTLEFVDVLETPFGNGLRGSTYRFFDPDGGFVALRPEMTTPIARLVSTRLRSMVDPGRFWYLSNVFRSANPEVGHRREFCQAGIEIVGSRSVFADAEAIALCVDCLDGCGLRGFGIDVGHMGFVNGLMEDLGLEDRVAADVRTALLHQDLVGLTSIVAALDLSQTDAERILALVDLRGDESVLERGKHIAGSSTRAQESIDELELVMRHLRYHRAHEPVCIDLGLVKNFDYYTGVIFQGHAFGVGYDICGGGRYDNLLAQFGFDCPSTGFAIGIERVLAAVERGNPGLLVEAPPLSCVIVFASGLEETALLDARGLRRQGFVVEVELDRRPLDSVRRRAARNGRSCILSYSSQERCDLWVDPRQADSVVPSVADALPSRVFNVRMLTQS